MMSDYSPVHISDPTELLKDGILLGIGQVGRETAATAAPLPTPSTAERQLLALRAEGIIPDYRLCDPCFVAVFRTLRLHVDQGTEPDRVQRHLRWLFGHAIYAFEVAR